MTDAAAVPAADAADRRWFAVAPDAVFEVLLAFDRYPLWWPDDIKIRVLTPPPYEVGTALVVGSPGLSFDCKVEAIEAPNRLVMRYDGSSHGGFGVWTLAARDGGTETSFTLDLEPRGLARLFMPMLDLAGIQARLAARIFDGLARHLEPA